MEVNGTKDYEDDILEVWFHSGGHYQYLHVPKIVYEVFLHAVSKGQFVYEKIKDHYPYRKIR